MEQTPSGCATITPCALFQWMHTRAGNGVQSLKGNIS